MAGKAPVWSKIRVGCGPVDRVIRIGLLLPYPQAFACVMSATRGDLRHMCCVHAVAGEHNFPKYLHDDKRGCVVYRSISNKESSLNFLCLRCFEMYMLGALANGRGTYSEGVDNRHETTIPVRRKKTVIIIEEIHKRCPKWRIRMRSVGRE
jgi:hypothetical protein